MADFDIERAETLTNIPHGFFGHGGGEHQYGYGGPGDAVQVSAARAEAADALVAGSCIVTPHQVHSADVIAVSEPWSDVAEGRPTGDAVVTTERGVALGVVTAD
ncbi:MAG: laccase domain-containing protein, partial [Pseudomonadota bacterium]